MTTSTQTRTEATDEIAFNAAPMDATSTGASPVATIAPARTVPATTAPVRTRGRSGFRAAVATRRAQRSELSRQIAAYPATRGVAVVVLR